MSSVPRLSILIPCLGGAADFDGTLVAVLQHRPADCEVLVIHREAYDDPYGLRGEVEFLRTSRESSLCGLVNAGLAAASGDVVHVLACGLTPQEGWAEPALAHFRDEEVAAVVPALFHADGSRLLAAGVRLSPGGRRCVLADRRLLLRGSGHLRARIGGPTFAAGFFRRDVLLALGGFNVAATDRLADVALALDLAALDLRAELEPASRIVQTADPWQTIPDWPLARGWAAERLFWQQATQIALPLALAAHALAVALDPTSLAGRLLALCELGSVRRNAARLAAAADHLRTPANERQVIPLTRRTLKTAPAATSERRRAA
jgi:hypothetical protein